MGDNVVEASVTIGRPVEDVFAFYRDFTNLPKFLGDVMAIAPTGPDTTRWTIQGPLGVQAHWTMRVTEARANELIRYHTVSAPGLTTSWDLHFARAATAGETVVREVMTMPLGELGLAAMALIGKFPAKEEAANLHRLKELLETGHVTDTSYAVAGKFGRA